MSSQSLHIQYRKWLAPPDPFTTGTQLRHRDLLKFPNSLRVLHCIVQRVTDLMPGITPHHVCTSDDSSGSSCLRLSDHPLFTHVSATSDYVVSMKAEGASTFYGCYSSFKAQECQWDFPSSRPLYKLVSTFVSKGGAFSNFLGQYRPIASTSFQEP